MCKVSARGVYYDLTLSPYEYVTPYGDIFKFSSAKKLEIYTRDITKELKRLDDLIKRNDLGDFIPVEIKQLIIKGVYKSFYCKVEVIAYEREKANVAATCDKEKEKEARTRKP